MKITNKCNENHLDKKLFSIFDYAELRKIDEVVCENDLTVIKFIDDKNLLIMLKKHPNGFGKDKYIFNNSVVLDLSNQTYESYIILARGGERVE